MHYGKDAEKLRATIPKEQVLESRFVKTRRECPDKPGVMEMKCPWCVKGFKDPEVHVVEKQSPTLAADTLSMVLQVISFSRCKMKAADVEGAFLQGPALQRPCGRIFVKLPVEGVPGVPDNVMVELQKHVYGLCDEPRMWWKCFSDELVGLGMKVSQLDLCCFLWHREGALQGILAFHVDDLIFAGSCMFEQTILEPLRKRFPFKHWKVGEAEFLGRKLKQKEDFSIECDQEQ